MTTNSGERVPTSKNSAKTPPVCQGIRDLGQVDEAGGYGGLFEAPV
jgi:hypothetical protein